MGSFLNTSPEPKTYPSANTLPNSPVEPTLNTPILSPSHTHVKTTSSPPIDPTQSASKEPISNGPKQRKQLTRDQRLQVHTLRKAGHSYESIVDFFKPAKVTFRQVAYAATQCIEPQNHKCGAKPKLDPETRRQVKALMENSTGPRPITYKEVSNQLGLGVSESTLRRARYERDDATARPYQYDHKGIKIRTTKVKSKEKSIQRSEARPHAGQPALQASTIDTTLAPIPHVSADLAASRTAALQDFIPRTEPKPA